MSSILSFAGPRFTTKRLTLVGMLIALEVVLEKISIGDPTILKFGFGFIATALIGYYLGPWWLMILLVTPFLILEPPFFRDLPSQPLFLVY